MAQCITSINYGMLFNANTSNSALVQRMSQSALSLKNISLKFDDVTIFDELSVELIAQQWTCLLGQSGCGKSTLLRVIAGLQQADSGTVEYANQPVKNSKNIAYMAQDDCLMPWLNAQDNVSIGARLRGELSPESQNKAHELLDVVGLNDHITSMPATLSGGQRQRVALARTLFEDCPIVLMDEPFSKLDAISRYKLQDLAAESLQGRTVVLVTHDPQEALRLSDAVYIMQGKPAKAVSLAVPETKIPRQIDAQLAALQQKIIDTLEVDYV